MQMAKPRQADKDQWSEVMHVAETEIHLKELEPSTEYKITIRTRNKYLNNCFRKEKIITTTVTTTSAGTLFFLQSNR